MLSELDKEEAETSYLCVLGLQHRVEEIGVKLAAGHP